VKKEGVLTMPPPLKKRTSGLPTGSPSRVNAYCDRESTIGRPEVVADRAAQKMLANRNTREDYIAATGRRFTF
jgi:hypothetical protein